MLTKNMTKQLYVLFLCAFLVIQTINPMPPYEFTTEPSLVNGMIYFACACAGAAFCTFLNLYCFNEPAAPIQKQIKKQNPREEAFQNQLKKLTEEVIENQLKKLTEEARQYRLNNAQEQEKKMENIGNTLSKGLLVISVSLTQQNLLWSQTLKQTQFITEMYNSLNKKNVLVPHFVATYWLGKYTETKKKLDAQENVLKNKQHALENNMPQQ